MSQRTLPFFLEKWQCPKEHSHFQWTLPFFKILSLVKKFCQSLKNSVTEEKILSHIFSDIAIFKEHSHFFLKNGNVQKNIAIFSGKMAMSKSLARHQLAEILPIFVARVLKKWQCSQAGADQGKWFFWQCRKCKIDTA